MALVGTGRKSLKFARQARKGVPRFLPNTHKPVTTEAEVELFFELRPQFTRGCKVDFERMAVAWNLRYVQQPGDLVCPQRILHSKDGMLLKRYHMHLDENDRRRTSELMRNARKRFDAPQPQGITAFDTLMKRPRVAGSGAGGDMCHGSHRQNPAGAGEPKLAPVMQSLSSGAQSGYYCQACFYIGKTVVLKRNRLHTKESCKSADFLKLTNAGRNQLGIKGNQSIQQWVLHHMPEAEKFTVVDRPAWWPFPAQH
jgi:hypothetical protein